MPKAASSVSFNPLTGASFFTDSAWLTVSPTCTMPKATGVLVFSSATAGVYTCPVKLTLAVPRLASALPVMLPLEARFSTCELPVKLPALAVFRLT